MAIKTHADLRNAAEQTVRLSEQFRHKREVYDRIIVPWREKRKAYPAWRNLCRTLDRVVYAAGGHRDCCTWHFLGQDLTAEALFQIQADDSTLPHFLFGGGQSAHTRLRIAAFWASTYTSLPKQHQRPPTDLPEYGGQMLEEWIYF